MPDELLLDELLLLLLLSEPSSEPPSDAEELTSSVADAAPLLAPSGSLSGSSSLTKLRRGFFCSFFFSLSGGKWFAGQSCSGTFVMRAGVLHRRLVVLWPYSTPR